LREGKRGDREKGREKEREGKRERGKDGERKEERQGGRGAHMLFLQIIIYNNYTFYREYYYYSLVIRSLFSLTSHCSAQ
jgi:hypothetical protein